MPHLDEPGNWEQLLERCRFAFEETGNPLFVWNAYGVCRPRNPRTGERRQARPLPDWLLGYLDECQRRLFDVELEVVPREHTRTIRGRKNTITYLWERRPARPGRPRTGTGEIGEAFGFARGLWQSRKNWGGAFDEREMLAMRVVAIMSIEGLSVHDAATRIADMKGASVSAATAAVMASYKYAAAAMRTRPLEATGAVPPPDRLVAAYSKLCKSRARRSPESSRNAATR